jgi:hypothetical protein
METHGDRIKLEVDLAFLESTNDTKREPTFTKT